MPSPSKTAATLVKIDKKSKAHTLSKSQKQFNQLTKKIATLRGQVSQWQAMLPQYQQQYQGQFLPLMDEFNQQRLLLVRLLDDACGNKIFSKKQRQHMGDLIRDTVEELLEYEPGEELKALFAKYHGQNYDTREQAMQQDLQTMLREEYGMVIDEPLDYRDPEAVMQKMYEYAQAQAAREEQASAEQENAVGKKPGKPAPDAARKAAPTKQDLKRQKQQAEQALAEEQLRGTLREVYRKLASALHPDRESDPAERERKTALMSQVNVAYDNEDFLRLLELQLEIEQIDAATIGSLSTERQKHYNRVLQEQVLQLEMELAQMVAVFQMRFPAMAGEMRKEMPTAATQLPRLTREVAKLQSALDELKHDVQAFADPKILKNWLAQLGKALRATEREQAQHRQMMEALFGQDWDGDEWPDSLHQFFQ